MLNPDGRLWIDRLSGGLEDTGCRVTPADAERIVRLVAHHVGVEVHAGSPARLRRAAGKRGAVRGPGAAGRGRAVLRHPPPGRRGVHARRLCRGRHHVRRPGRAAARRRPRAQEHPRRRRHLDRQDHAGQRAAGRGRQDRRPGGADRGYARAAMRRAQPRGAAHQGRRRLALRSRPLRRCGCGPTAFRSARCAAPRRSIS